MLMVLDVDFIEDPGQRSRALSALAAVLPGALRLTDIKGWYEADASLGILVTEMGKTDPQTVKRKVSRKIASGLLQFGSGSWSGPIRVTTSLFDDGVDPTVHSETLDLTLAVHPETAPALPAAPSSSNRFPLTEQLALFMMDNLCILSTLLLIARSRSWSDPQSDGLLAGESFLSFLIILFVTVVFGLYRTERLLMGKRGISRVAVATSVVAVLSILCTLLPTSLFTSPEHFLGQTFIGWFISFSWKAIYASHRSRSQTAKALWVEHRNTP
jgi:hypothetical protein